MEGRVRQLTNCLGAEVDASCPGHRGWRVPGEAGAGLAVLPCAGARLGAPG